MSTSISATEIGLPDNVKLKLGTGDDLEIYHDSNNSYVQDSGTGNLIIAGSAVNILNAAASESMIRCAENGSVELYYDNSKVLETMTQGVRITDNFLEINDTSCHLDLMENGSSNNHRIRQNAGNLYIQKLSDDKNTSTTAILVDGGNEAVELYQGGNKKFETTSTGSTNTGVSKFITGSGSTANDDHVVHIVAGGTADRGIKIGTGRASGASQNDGMGYIDAINSESNGYGSQLQLRIDGTAVMTVGYNSDDFVGIGTTAPNKTLQVDSQSSSFNHFIAEFTGVNSTNAASLNFFYMGCGSNDNRTGLYWEHQNVVNIRMWMDDTGTLRQSSSNPTAHNSGTAFSYAGGSDYRLKTNVVNYTNAITELKQLKPYKFNYIETDRTLVDKPDVLCSGFYAHEAGAVVPQSLIGAKDEVDFEGNPVYQSLKYEKFVPLLVAAVQELTAKVEALEAK